MRLSNAKFYEGPFSTFDGSREFYPATTTAPWLTRRSILSVNSVEHPLFSLFFSLLFIPPPDIRSVVTFELPLISLNRPSRVRRNDFYQRGINVGRLSLNLADSEKSTAHILPINRRINPGVSRYQLSPDVYPRAGHGRVGHGYEKRKFEGKRSRSGRAEVKTKLRTERKAKRGKAARHYR